MELNAATSSLLLCGILFAALQIWWIGSLLKRNQHRSGAQPLSGKAFQDELERIFRNSP